MLAGRSCRGSFDDHSRCGWAPSGAGRVSLWLRRGWRVRESACAVAPDMDEERGPLLADSADRVSDVQSGYDEAARIPTEREAPSNGRRLTAPVTPGTFFPVQRTWKSGVRGMLSDMALMAVC